MSPFNQADKDVAGVGVDSFIRSFVFATGEGF